MAKSIRSKVKKRNRTEMRKTVGDLHQKKLQARCTAKLRRAVAFSQGDGAAKLRTMLTAAQAANPPTKEASKNVFSFRHPDAPPPLPVEDDDFPPPAFSITRRGRQRTRSGSLSDEEMKASSVGGGSDTTMSYVGVEMDEDADAVPPSKDPAPGDEGMGMGHERKAAEDAKKLKKRLKKARRRGGVQYPSAGNPIHPAAKEDLK